VRRAFSVCIVIGLANAWAALGCGLAPWTSEGELRLGSESGEPLDQLPLVPRLFLEGDVPLAAEDLWLVRGRLSDKDLGQILASAPGEALAERRVPLSVWSGERRLHLAPLDVLEPSQEYSLFALSLGELGRVTTSPLASPIWWRWGPSVFAAGGWAVHCAEPPPWTLASKEELEPEASTGPRSEQAPLEQALLEPGAVAVDLFGGFSEGSAGPADLDVDPEGPRGCVRFRVPEGAPLLLPPHQFAGRYFEPSPLVIESASEGEAEPDLGVRVEGSAAYLELPALAAEISVLDLASGDEVHRVRAQAIQPSSLLLGLFAPGEYALSVSLLGPGGRSSARSLSFSIQESRGHPVLSEALANPLGPEPEAEWIEIVNVGRAPLRLAGYVLEDSSGETELPASVLQPGGVGLVVRGDFVAGGSGDVVPSATTVAIVVAEIGDGGLTNAGEAIRLRDAAGQILSEIPALASDAGQSVARLHLLAPDWATSFRVHAPPGASPGRQNE